MGQVCSLGACRHQVVISQRRPDALRCGSECFISWESRPLERCILQGGLRFVYLIVLGGELHAVVIGPWDVVWCSAYVFGDAHSASCSLAGRYPQIAPLPWR